MKWRLPLTIVLGAVLHGSALGTVPRVTLGQVALPTGASPGLVCL